MEKRVTRWSGAEWAGDQRDILLIGAGGIGSWTAINLSRIGHNLVICDGDVVDDTNVAGGQAFRTTDVGRFKADAIEDLCRQFGAIGEIYPITTPMLGEEFNIDSICICAVDNMKARRAAFLGWQKWVIKRSEGAPSLFIDGRLTMEMHEVFCIQSDRPEQMSEYETIHLFSDAEAQELDCTAKQSTFAAMGIASIITTALCNWIVNQKYGEQIRDVPFYIRHFLPIFESKKRDAQNPEIIITEQAIPESKIVVEPEYVPSFPIPKKRGRPKKIKTESL